MELTYEYYKTKYFQQLDEFCCALMGNDTEGLMCSSYSFLMLSEMYKKYPDAFESEVPVKLFLYITARNRCLHRLRYLQIKNGSRLVKKINLLKRLFKKHFN